MPEQCLRRWLIGAEQVDEHGYVAVLDVLLGGQKRENAAFRGLAQFLEGRFAIVGGEFVAVVLGELLEIVGGSDEPLAKFR